MSVDVGAFDADYEALVERKRARQRTGRLVDATLLWGLLLAVVLSSIDPRSLGIADASFADQAMIVAQRLAVYIPVLIGGLFGVRAGRVVWRLPVVTFAGFAVWALVAATTTEHPVDELDRALWFAAFVLLVVMVTVRVGWEQLLVSSAAVGAAFVVVGLVAHYLGLLPIADTEFFDGRLFGIDRVRGLSAQENAFGRVGAYVALIGLLMLTTKDLVSRRPLAVAVLLVGVAGVLTSQSRFALISLFFAAVIALARYVPAARVFSSLLVVAAGAGVGLILITGSLGPFARTDEPGEATSLFGRTEVWEQAVQTTIDEPVFGIGTEGLTQRYLELDAAGVYDWNPTNAHSVFLQTSASHGVIGTALFVASLLVGLAWALRSDVPGALELLVMFSIQGFVESILIGNPTIAPLLLVGALTALTIDDLSVGEAS